MAFQRLHPMQVSSVGPCTALESSCYSWRPLTLLIKLDCRLKSLTYSMAMWLGMSDNSTASYVLSMHWRWIRGLYLYHTHCSAAIGLIVPLPMLQVLRLQALAYSRPLQQYKLSMSSFGRCTLCHALQVGHTLRHTDFYGQGLATIAHLSLCCTCSINDQHYVKLQKIQ